MGPRGPIARIGTKVVVREISHNCKRFLKNHEACSYLKVRYSNYEIVEIGMIERKSFVKKKTSNIYRISYDIVKLTL